MPFVNKNLNFAVLSDGETFGGVEDAALYFGPDAETVSDEEWDSLQNGELPMTVLDTWPHIEFKLDIRGNLVAVFHGIPGEKDGYRFTLLTEAQFRVLSGKA